MNSVSFNNTQKDPHDLICHWVVINKQCKISHAQDICPDKMVLNTQSVGPHQTFSFRTVGGLRHNYQLSYYYNIGSM